MINKYTLLADRFEFKAGTTAYEFSGYDYGLRRDDELETGMLHLVLTLDAMGEKGPFFTIPLADVELV